MVIARKSITLIALVIGLAAATTSQAETVYVIDKLLVGVHAQRDLDSAIVKVLPTGSKLEVIEREGELALIRDGDGSQGWVDTAYLMNDPPAREKLDALEKANAALKKQLAAGGAGAPAAGNGAEIDKLTKENTELKRKLSSEIMSVAKLQETVADLNGQLVDRPLSAAETQVTELKKEITAVKKELEQSMQTNRDLKAKARDAAGSAIPEVKIEGFSWPILVAIGILLGIAYGGGVYTMDYMNRRRHGGFRV